MMKDASLRRRLSLQSSSHTEELLTHCLFFINIQLYFFDLKVQQKQANNQNLCLDFSKNNYFMLDGWPASLSILNLICFYFGFRVQIRLYLSIYFIKFQMSVESKNRELLGTTRLLIPTPSQGLVRCESDDTSALLRMYYSNYQRLKKEQSTLTNQLAIIEREREELRERLDAMRREQEEKRKRHRRTAGEINRDFVCPLGDCQRKYGSEGSLLQHIKIKHSAFYNSEEYEAMVLSKHKKNKERLIAYSLNSGPPK